MVPINRPINFFIMVQKFGAKLTIGLVARHLHRFAAEACDQLSQVLLPARVASLEEKLVRNRHTSPSLALFIRNDPGGFLVGKVNQFVC